MPSWCASQLVDRAGQHTTYRHDLTQCLLALVDLGREVRIHEEVGQVGVAFVGSLSSHEYITMLLMKHGPEFDPGTRHE